MVDSFSFMRYVRFERALFFSWYCGRGDCKFCFMSTQKSNIKDPKKARRSKESILAEAIICKNLGWDIEFLSGGYESFDFDELRELIKDIYMITGKKQWINMGVLPEDKLAKLVPFLEGFCGAVECVNKKVHDDVCPSKPIREIEKVFDVCDKYNLKKAMTLVIGIGETIEDFEELKKFIEKHDIDRITFYSLNPHKGTPFSSSPSKEYYAEWINKTRKAFPKLHIIAGAWVDKPEYYSVLLKAGADNITKFPVIEKFNSDAAKEVERQVKLAGMTLKGSLTKLPDIDWDKEVESLDLGKDLKERIKKKLNQYLLHMY